MATFQDYKNLTAKIKQGISNQPTYDQLQRLYSTAFYILQDFPDEKDYAFKVTSYVKYWCAKYLNRTGNAMYNELYYSALLIEAQNHNVDSGLLYLERYRDAEDRFYMPRRKQFIEYGLIQALQDMIDDKIDILSLSLPPGVGKTTLGEMFVSLFIGWFPDTCNLFSSHSGHVTRMVYDVVCNVIGINLKKGQIAEYAWKESKRQIISV